MDVKHHIYFVTELNVHCIYLSVYLSIYISIYILIIRLVADCVNADLRSARNKPCKHAGTDSHPGRIGSEALARSGPDDSCTLAGSIWPKLGTISQN